MSLQFHSIVKNGSIELPVEVRRAVQNNTEVTITLEQGETTPENSLFESLFASPLQTEASRPLTREEAHHRS